MGLGDKIMVELSTINLPLVLRNEKCKREVYAEFVVVDITLAYNVIFGLPILNYYGILINMGALCLKLPALGGLVIIQGSQK